MITVFVGALLVFIAKIVLGYVTIILTLKEFFAHANIIFNVRRVLLICLLLWNISGNVQAYLSSCIFLVCFFRE